MKDEDKPYVENYPPLHAWLKKHGAHCNWQVPIGGARKPTAYVESWILRGGREVIVVVRARKRGWDIYTPEQSAGVEETLRAVEVRIGLGGDSA
jgi:hypothetical protein